MLSAAQRKARATLASRTAHAHRNPSDPEACSAIAEARVAYKLVSAEDYIRRLVDAAPPLTPEQRDRLAMLLRPIPRRAVTLMPPPSRTREIGPSLATRTDSNISTGIKTDPTVTQLIDHLEQMQHRVVQDALREAQRSYWLQRADAFRAAWPRQADWHGTEGMAGVRRRRERLRQIIAACEHKAEVAMWQDGGSDVA